uniref:Chitin-binding type-2 domain-containing protein n=1 Tax=Scylla olivacea TaxID=85551 RepID=A0A0P4W2L5_SCYOL
MLSLLCPIVFLLQKEATVPLLGAIPDTPFRCLGHSAGYYADPDTGCQVYHMCDSLERQYSYLCPNYTLFNQKFMVCDHWYMVNCSSSPTFYHLNSHIGEGRSSLSIQPVATLSMFTAINSCLISLLMKLQCFIRHFLHIT